VTVIREKTCVKVTLGRSQVTYLREHPATSKYKLLMN